MFPHFIRSMLLAYIDSIELLVASAHAQMQMKQAIFVVEKICVGPYFFATVVVTPLQGNVDHADKFMD